MNMTANELITRMLAGAPCGSCGSCDFETLLVERLLCRDEEAEGRADQALARAHNKQ